MEPARDQNRKSSGVKITGSANATVRPPGSSGSSRSLAKIVHFSRLVGESLRWSHVMIARLVVEDQLSGGCSWTGFHDPHHALQTTYRMHLPKCRRSCLLSGLSMRQP